MNRTAARQHPGRLVSLPRVLLLVLLALGVCGMHTLGHGDGGHAANGHGTAGRLPHHTLTAAGQDGSHHLRLLAQLGEPTPAGSMDMNLFSVCLAVLGAIGLVVGLALRRVRSHPERFVARTRLAVHRGGRGPPVPLLGLRVAAVSVLRI